MLHHLLVHLLVHLVHPDFPLDHLHFLHLFFLL